MHRFLKPPSEAECVHTQVKSEDEVDAEQTPPLVRAAPSGARARRGSARMGGAGGWSPDEAGGEDDGDADAVPSSEEETEDEGELTAAEAAKLRKKKARRMRFGGCDLRQPRPQC